MVDAAEAAAAGDPWWMRLLVGIVRPAIAAVAVVEA